MKVKFVNYPKGYKKYQKEYDKAYQRVMESGDLILRKDVEEFENKLTEYVGTKYAVALNSGTDALVLALRAAGVGSEHWSVSVPSHTFKSTAGAVKTAHPDAIIDLYDLDEIPEDADIGIVAHISGEIYPLIPVNYFLIEDAAQALGAVKNPTSFAQTWSVYPAKILGSFGDAGALTTNNFSVYEYAKEARNHFKTDHRDFGMNSRMDNLQAAFLNVKFRYIDKILERRNEIAQWYLLELEGVGLPHNQPGRIWQDFIIHTKQRDSLYEFLKENNIETIKNEYPFSLKYPKLPLAAQYEAETLRIPCNENLEDEEVQFVIDTIKKFYDK